MKDFLIIFNKKLQFGILFILLSIIKKIYSEETLNEKIKSICLKAESSVKSYFEEKQELPEKYQNLEFVEEISENEKKLVINLLLLDEETKNTFMQKKNNEKKYVQLILNVIVITSAIFAFNFEIHFFLRLCFKKDILTPSFINFYKISPFYWIFYLMLNKQKINALYNKFLNKHTSRKSKFIIFTLGFVIFVITMIIFILTLFNYNEKENSTQVTTNVLCTSIKLLNEIQNGKQINKDGSHLIGFKNISLFLNDLLENKNLLKNYYNNYTQIYNEVNNNLSEWESLLIDIQKNLSDKSSLKYFFYNYPSNPEFITCNYGAQNPCNKSLYQTKIIYDYYPYNDNTKTLWSFNNILSKNTEILFEKYKVFEDFFIELEDQLNFCSENVNIQNGFSKIGSIINIYIQYLLEIDKEIIFDKLVYSYLSNIYSFDFILLIFIGLNTLLALMYIEYYYVKKYFFGRVIISVVFFNIIFMILAINFIGTEMLKKINVNYSYIKEISKGIYYILNDEIEDYETLFNEKDNSFFKNISLIMQFKNTEMNNNLFNYIIYYINNENKLLNLLNDKILHINTTKVKTINNTLNDYNKNDLTTLNDQMNDFSENILKIINEGLKYSTKFVDLTTTGFLNSSLEYPLTYLTYVNIKTRKKSRGDFEYKDIPCDESWNISTFDYIIGNFKYKPKYLVLCENCDNICSNDKILLNFMEYTIEEIEQRYSFLKYGINNDTYYELMYYFNATEKLRDKKIFEQLEDFYKMNEKLNNIQKNIYNSIEKMEFIAKTVITIYGNIINKYEKEDTIFNYTEYIKNDLYYLIGQIKINFSQKISKEYTKHSNINIMCICTCFSLILFYILFSKEMKYYKKDNEVDDASSIEENSKSPEFIIQNSIKIGEINVKGGNQGSPNIKNIINTYIINDGKNKKTNKNLSNKNKNIIENYNEKHNELLDARKISINNDFKKMALSSAEIDENKNDESRFGLTKGLMIENKKQNVLDNISKDNHHYLNTENKIIRNKKIII